MVKGSKEKVKAKISTSVTSKLSSLSPKNLLAKTKKTNMKRNMSVKKRNMKHDMKLHKRK